MHEICLGCPGHCFYLSKIICYLNLIIVAVASQLSVVCLSAKNMQPGRCKCRQNLTCIKELGENKVKKINWWLLLLYNCWWECICLLFWLFYCRYGHHDCITAIDSLTRERAVTCGGRDRSVRIWKIVEESQLIFHGHK